MEQSQQNPTQSTLKPKQLLVIEAILRGETISNATKLAGVDRSTYYGWLKDDPEFEAAQNFARHEAAEGIRIQLAGLVNDAVSVVGEIMKDPKMKSDVRLRAALAVIRSVLTKDDPVSIDITLQKWQNDSDPLSKVAKLARSSV